MSLKTVEHLREIYNRYGHEFYGEDVTQLSHALHCAILAKSQGHDDSFILAAFFHDLGHLLEVENNGLISSKKISLGNIKHEIIGADYLIDLGFGKEITEPIREHVRAKQYLCYSNPHYLKQLSKASQETLQLQGGSFNEKEAVDFMKTAFFQQALALRMIDDGGKGETFTMDDAEWIFRLTQNYLKSKK